MLIFIIHGQKDFPIKKDYRFPQVTGNNMMRFLKEIERTEGMYHDFSRFPGVFPIEGRPIS